jgi:twinkle protein
MPFVRKVSCPECQSKDNVAVYQDGSAFNGQCWGCGAKYRNMDPNDPQFDYRQWEGYTYQPAQSSSEGYREETVEEISQYPIMAVDERWELPDAQLYQVRSRVDQYGNVDAVYYPYHREGKIKAYKRRILADKSFSVVGSMTGADLMGLHLVPNGADVCVLVEGEDDIAGARAIFRMYGKGYFVTSVPTGATLNLDTGEAVIDKPLLRQLPKLSMFKRVYLCLDQDEPGRKLAEAVAEELAVYTEVRIVSFSLKDARDMWLEGRGKEFWESFCNAVRYTPEALVRAEDVPLEKLMEPLREGLPIVFPELNNMMHGLRYGGDAGEVTLLCGGSGTGKTTAMRAIISHLMKHTNEKITTIFLEEQYRKTMQGIVSQYWGIPLPVLRANPSMLPADKWREALEAQAYGRQFFYRHFGSLASDKLINLCHYAHAREGCNLIFLDHISMVVAGQEVGRGGERKDIDKLMHNLASFCTVTGCSVIAAVHLKRGERKLKYNQDGVLDLSCAPYDRGGEISKEDLRGSGGLEQMTMNIWALEGNVYGDDQRFPGPNYRWWRVLKQREWGQLGLAGAFTVDPKTGLVSPAKCVR